MKRYYVEISIYEQDEIIGKNELSMMALRNEISEESFLDKIYNGNQEIFNKLQSLIYWLIVNPTQRSKDHLR